MLFRIQSSKCPDTVATPYCATMRYRNTHWPRRVTKNHHPAALRSAGSAEPIVLNIPEGLRSTSAVRMSSLGGAMAGRPGSQVEQAPAVDGEGARDDRERHQQGRPRSHVIDDGARHHGQQTPGRDAQREA